MPMPPPILSRAAVGRLFAFVVSMDRLVGVCQYGQMAMHAKRGVRGSTYQWGAPPWGHSLRGEELQPYVMEAVTLYDGGWNPM